MTFRRFLPFLLLFFALPARAQSFNFLDDEAEKGGYDVTAQVAQAPAEFFFNHAENGDAYNLKIAPQALQLFVVRGNKPRLLAQTAGKWRFPAAFVAQRRGARWRFILNNRIALEAEDDSFSEGQIGTRGAVAEARVQPIEPIRFDDDFMRVASEVALKDALKNPRDGVKINGLQLQESIWSVAAGRFATTGLTENAEAQVAQSANPFAFRPLDAGGNLALSGRPFWSDYAAQISVQPQGASEIGLVVYAQNPKNYLGMFWGEKLVPELRSVIDGRVTVLDRAVNFDAWEKNQWTRWRLEIVGGQLRGFLDDAEVLRARTGLFGRGQVGVWAKLPRAGDDKKGEGAIFDDASVRSIADFHDDFGKVVPGRWVVIAGKWSWQGAARPGDARGAYAAMGEPDWTGYRVSADLSVARGAAAGLLLNHLAGKGAYLLRVQNSAQGVGKAQIALIQNGKTTVLGEKSLGSRWNSTSGRWSLEASDGYLRAQIANAELGEQLVVDAFDVSLAQGRAGIMAQNGTGAAKVSNFSVEWPQNSSKWAKVPELYEVESQAQTMGGWSTPQGFWIARPNSEKSPATGNATAGNATPGNAALSNAVWHKGEFFGDENLQFALPDLSGDKTLQLLFKGATGEKLTLTLGQKDALTANLSDGKRSWDGAAKIAAGAKIEIARRGTFFIVRSGETVVLAARI